MLGQDLTRLDPESAEILGKLRRRTRRERGEKGLDLGQDAIVREDGKTDLFICTGLRGPALRDFFPAFLLVAFFLFGQGFFHASGGVAGQVVLLEQGANLLGSGTIPGR